LNMMRFVVTKISVVICRMMARTTETQLEIKKNSAATGYGEGKQMIAMTNKTKAGV
jgi:hypothetical protein